MSLYHVGSGVLTQAASAFTCWTILLAPNLLVNKNAKALEKRGGLYRVWNYNLPKGNPIILDFHPGSFS